MVSPVNSRDIYLQAAATRVTDEVLTKEEKPSLVSNYTDILQNQLVLDATATKYTITTEKTAYDTSISDLTTYLATLTIPVIWTDTTTITYVNRAFLNIKLNNIATNRKVLELAINAKAAITGYLTNPAVTLSADSSGTVASLSPGTGVYRVFSGQTEVTGSLVTYSVVTATGLAISIASATGVYTLTSISSPTASATLRASYSGFTIDYVYTVAKATAGTNGSNGANGSSGSNGQRGTATVAISGYSSWPSTTAGANSAFYSSGYSTGPYDRDIMTLYNSTYSETRYYQSGSWIVLTSYINGNMLVSGTLSANTISGGTLNGVIVRFGSGHTPSGNAFEIVSTGVVWTDNLFGGIVTADNSHSTSAPAIQGASNGNIEALVGQVYSGNSSAGAHGVRGKNIRNSASGLIGGANNYDFYADGAGTNYGPFTGAHDILIPLTTPIDIGDIVYDVTCVSRNGLSNTIFEVAASDVANKKTVIGVLVHADTKLSDFMPAAFIDGYDEDGGPIPNIIYSIAKDTYMVGGVNALGEGQMNVCGENGNIEAGDLIVTSSIPGKGMKQSDDIVRNISVAKAREPIEFSSPTEIKNIACIYICG